MIVLPRVRVQTFSVNHLDISWEVQDTTELLDNYSFSIYRAGGEHGPWTKLNTEDLIDTYRFRDSDVNLFSKNKDYFYKIRITDLTTLETSETDPQTIESTPDLIALEIARRNEVYLEQIGRLCYIYTQRHWGSRCTSCYDRTLKKVVTSNCKSCFGTGWAGGYHRPIVSYVNIVVPSMDLKQMDIGDVETNYAKLWMGNFPLLEPRDIIIDNENNRWRVMTPVNSSAKLGTVTSQTANLFQLSPSDPEFSLPIFERPGQNGYLKYPAIEHHYNRLTDYIEGVTEYDKDTPKAKRQKTKEDYWEE